MMTGTYTEDKITKISQVTPEVTLFLRNLGFSNYYIIKIFALVGEAAIGLTEDNPYWLLEEFPSMPFEKADKAAGILGIPKDSVYRREAAITGSLGAYAANGHTYAPAEKFCRDIGNFLEIEREKVRDTVEDMTMEGRLQLTNLNGEEVIYFYAYYNAECRIVSKIADMAGENPRGIAANMDAVIRKAESEMNIRLSEEQRQAVKSSLNRNVSIISGGPGTGKTTIINMLIRIMETGGLQVAVAAPTGRAAKRITETGGKPALTVHRLLEYYYDEEADCMAFGRNRSNPLDYDAVIVDESSMMDLMLMNAVLQALKDGCRLILTGDADQLPSVGAGNVLADLIDSGYVHTSVLTEIFRQEEESEIVLNAHRINKGDYPVYGGDFILEHEKRQQDILRKVAEIASQWPLKDVQVLTPTKKGILGSKNLNDSLRQVFNPGEKGKSQAVVGGRIFRCGDRVMQQKNNYKLEFMRKDGTSGKGIFNGETGIITAVRDEDKELVVCYDEERWVEYSYVQLDEIEPAYAVTVHKSQGSEYPVVIIPMSWFPPVLATRNLIYTAVTRSKKKVIVVGEGEYLNAMIDNAQRGMRNSGLKDRLINLYEGI